MKYARWRMLTRVGSVLSLCTRHAMNAALKSGDTEIKNKGFCFACLLAGKVGGVTCCDHAHFERHDMAQQLSSEVRVTGAGAASRGHNSHLSLNHSCIGTQSSAVCCCCQRSIATRPCMNILRRLMRRHAVAIFVAANDSLGLGLAYTRLREPTAAESDAMLRGGVMG